MIVMVLMGYVLRQALANAMHRGSARIVPLLYAQIIARNTGFASKQLTLLANAIAIFLGQAQIVQLLNVL